jgi:outer membrane immunogenic protein
LLEPNTPAFGDEDVARPKRERVAPRRAEPRRAEPARAAPQQQASNWTGSQAGGSNGASSVNNTFVEPGAYICPEGTEFGFDCFETPLVFSNNKVSYTAGVFAGYRMQFGWAVVGVEGDFNFKSANSSSSLAVETCFESSDYCTFETKSGNIKQTWDASIRGRFGWLVTPWTLLYVTGGVAFGEIQGSFFYKGVAFEPPFDPCCHVVVGTATAAGTWRDVRTGGTVGAGIESEIWTRVKARLEYRYTDFGTYTKNLPVSTICDESFPCDTPSSNVSIDLKSNFHRVMVGLGFDLF